MGVAPPRYLAAYLQVGEPGHRVLLRFPPGVTLEDAGCDWVSLVTDSDSEPTLPRGTIDRLSGLGVETIAVGHAAVGKAIRRARAPSSSLRAFAEDYLDVNARLGGERCVTVHDYAMYTWINGEPLSHALRRRLRQMEDVRVYGDVAFRARDLPGTLRPRLIDLVDLCWNDYPKACVPCRLHGRWEKCGDFYDLGRVIYVCVRKRSRGVRIAVPRRLLEKLDVARIGKDARRMARAARAVVRIVLDSLPEGAWESSYPGPAHSDCRDFPMLVASARAETCEEYKMLLRALKKCRSPREVVRRGRNPDPSWVVSRVLEGLGSRG